jgi:hypothetical protein
MFDSFAELLRGLAISLLIALVLLLALPGAKAGPQPVAAHGAAIALLGQ